MDTRPKPKGRWIIRFAVRLCTLVLAVLVFWLLGFLVQDIRSIRGPQYSRIEQKHVDGDLVKAKDSLGKQIAELTRQIDEGEESQRLIGDSSQNLQQTINQLLALQRLGIEKNVVFSDTEQANFTTSLNLFLENQKKYQDVSQTVSGLLRQKHDLGSEERRIGQEIERQRKPARVEYNRLSAKHRLRLAFLQLAILVPLLAVAAGLIIKRRASMYFPLFLAFGGATLLKVCLVVHEYFPRRYVKYILLVALLLAVARVLIHFIRTIAFPKAQWLAKQYREAYERFLCPVCEYPIRIGPRRFLFWTRRTVTKVAVPRAEEEQQEAYTCPSCGTALFEECSSCHKTRHALLPHCQHCGAAGTTE